MGRHSYCEMFFANISQWAVIPIAKCSSRTFRNGSSFLLRNVLREHFAIGRHFIPIAKCSSRTFRNGPSFLLRNVLREHFAMGRHSYCEMFYANISQWAVISFLL